MNRRGFLKLCGMVVVGVGLPAGSLLSITGPTVGKIVAKVHPAHGPMFSTDFWAESLFNYALLNMQPVAGLKCDGSIIVETAA